jgi:hypothetical protein
MLRCVRLPCYRFGDWSISRCRRRNVGHPGCWWRWRRRCDPLGVRRWRWWRWWYRHVLQCASTPCWWWRWRRRANRRCWWRHWCDCTHWRCRWRRRRWWRRAFAAGATAVGLFGGVRQAGQQRQGDGKAEGQAGSDDAVHGVLLGGHETHPAPTMWRNHGDARWRVHAMKNSWKQIVQSSFTKRH